MKKLALLACLVTSLAAFSCGDDDAGSADNGDQNTDAGDDSSDSSTSECAENATRCSGDSKSVETCHSNEWKKTSTCDATETCTDGVCGPTSGECTENAKRCSGNAVQTCNSNAWSAAVPCGTGETCSDGVCGCTDAATRCGSDGKSVETCNSNVWSLPSRCPEFEKCVDGACQPPPQLGDPCDPETFEERCENGDAVKCGDMSEMVLAEDCHTWDDGCVMVSGIWAYCAVNDAWDDCEHEGVNFNADPGHACQDFPLDGTISFDWCEKHGDDWLIYYDFWYATGVCVEGDVYACTSGNTYSSTTCESGQCLQFWDEAVCLTP